MKKLFIILLSCLFISFAFSDAHAELGCYEDLHKEFSSIDFTSNEYGIYVKSFFISKVIPHEKGYYEIEFTSLVSDRIGNLTSFSKTYYVKKGDTIPLYMYTNQENYFAHSIRFIKFKFNKFENNIIYLE